MRWFILTLVLILTAACQPSAVTPEQLPPLMQLIDFWKPVTGTLAVGETHLWQFVGGAGDPISARITHQGGAVTLSLLDNNGTRLDQGNSLQVILPADGLYRLQVQDTGLEAATYELGLGYTDRPNPADATPTPLPQVVGIPTPTPPYYATLGTFVGRIASGETRNGTLADSAERHVYTFEGTTGTSVTLRMGRVSGAIDPVITLYAPDASVIALDDNSGGDREAVLRNIRLFQDGLYSVQVSGAGFPGDYTLSLLAGAQPFPVTPTIIAPVLPTSTPEALTPTLAPAYNNATLEDHVPLTGSLARPGDFARFLVYASAGEIITIGVRPLSGSTLQPKIELVAPSGAPVASATAAANGVALLQGYPVTTSEESAYQVILTVGDTVGAYQIGFGRGETYDDLRRGDAAPDALYSEILPERGLRDVWSVYLNTGDVITAAVTTESATFDPVLELVAPDGSVLAADDNSGGGRNALVSASRAPVSGLYHLRVAGVDGAAGSYTLVWRYVNLAPTATPFPALLPVLAADGFVGDEAYAFYPFQGLAGQSVRIEVIARPGSDFDPVAALIAPDGSEIATGDDSEGDLNPRFIASLPTDGTYTVRVTGYLSSGAFTVTVDRLVTP
ncbi:MAG: PPC domain-containing protein [Anaerolineaceae bacterium]|nr:PPC domain-containing protein [Anaerolineaceae bacterium]